MILHIAGVPTATEQRCVRCCEVIAKIPDGPHPFWPGQSVAFEYGLSQYCEAVDLSRRDMPVELL